MPTRLSKADLDSDPTGLLHAEYLTDYRDAKKREHDASERRKALYGVLHKAIPKEILNTLSSTANFKEDVELKQDALELWRLLNERCGAGMAVNKSLVDVNINQKFYNLRQKERQSLTSYYDELTNIISMYTSAGMTAPSLEHQAITFMKGADPKRFGQAV